MNGMMMTMSRDGPTLAERVGHLVVCLEGIRGRCRDAVAHVFGGSAARAVRDWVRSLLGGTNATEYEEKPRASVGFWAGDEDEDDDEIEHGAWRTEAEEAPGRHGLMAWLAAALAPVAAWLLTLFAWD